MSSTSPSSPYRKARRAVRLVIDKIPYLNRRLLVSAGYRVISRQAAQEFVAQSGSASWSRAARVQQKIYNQLVADALAGSPRADIRVATESLAATGLRNPTVLEVGCGNGYYSEMLEALVPGGVRYTGADYSAAMVESARIKYPTRIFLQADTTDMELEDNSFDIVMDGVSLMHILEYSSAISEIARVASDFVILNSLPVFDAGETCYLTKYAYGFPVVEIIFGREELEGLLADNGLEIIRATASLPYDVHHATGRHSRYITYLARKRRPSP